MDANSQVVLAVNEEVCHHCRRPFKKLQAVYAIGVPYHILVHHHCAPYLNTDNQYPHDKPLSFYKIV